MADVIRMGDRPARAPRKSESSGIPQNGAVILLFTGIRYERLDGASVKTRPAGAVKKH